MTHFEQTTKATRQSSPNRLIKDVMESLEGLQSIYETETNALEAADTKTFLEIQEKKLLFADQYRHCIERSIARKNEIKQADPELKKRLQEMQSSFSELTLKNVNALQRMQRCSERLGNTLRNATKTAIQKKRNLGYGETGIMKDNRKQRITVSLSETA